MAQVDDWPAVWSVEDLANWPAGETGLAVLGHPVAHSLSPVMHHAALKALAVDDPRFARWRYVRLEGPPERLGEAMEAMLRAGFAGANLTVPLKEEAVRLAYEVDPRARRMGAVNTLIRTGDHWRGANTDGFGLEAALREELGVELAETPMILLGAGGAARGAAVQALDRGCPALWLANRTPERLVRLAEGLKEYYPEARIHLFDPAQPPEQLPEAAVLVNATSAGLREGDASPWPASAMRPGWKVFDMIYRTEGSTPLVTAARMAGLEAVTDGLGMLLHQGIGSLELWVGGPVPAEPMRQALLEAAGRRPSQAGETAESGEPRLPGGHQRGVRLRLHFHPRRHGNRGQAVRGRTVEGRILTGDEESITLAIETSGGDYLERRYRLDSPDIARIERL